MSFPISNTSSENLTVTVTAGALASPDGNRALIYVGGAPIRWRADGTAPTATTGMFVPAGSYIDWTDPGGEYAAMIRHVQFIRDTTAAANATLAVSYFE
jgi:hypothetical protein